MAPCGGRFTIALVLALAGDAEAGTKLTYCGASKNYCYGYFHNNKEYCWLMNPQGHWAKDTDTYPCKTYLGYDAEDWCESMPEPKPKTVKYEDEAKTDASASCNPSKLGQSIANFVKSKEGHKVGYSRRRVGKKTTTQCWDLAAAAIDHANNNGFQVDRWCTNGCGNYAWSAEVVPVSQAMPGDIVQFIGKYTEGNMWCASGGVHTAVVTECGQTALDLVVMEQNPKPVHKNTYQPSKGKSASAHVDGFSHPGVYVYRLKDKSSSKLFEDQGEPIEDDAGYIDDVDEVAASGAFTACIAAALVAFVVGGLFIAWRRRKVNHCGVRDLASEEGVATEMEVGLTKDEGIVEE
jgi:hypothetical protein